MENNEDLYYLNYLKPHQELNYTNFQEEFVIDLEQLSPHPEKCIDEQIK